MHEKETDEISWGQEAIHNTLLLKPLILPSDQLVSLKWLLINQFKVLYPSI